MSDTPTPTPVVVVPKNFWQSRTFWVNIIIAGVGLVVYILTAIQSGQLQSPFAIAPDTLSFWIGVLNLIMRWVTTQPIQQAVSK